MKQALLLISAAVMLTACGSSGFTVKGEIQGLEGKVYLALMQGKTPQIIDSTDVKDGKFEFKGKLELPMLAQIENSDHKAVSQFFIENSKITIKGSTDNQGQITVTGSKEHDLATHFADIIPHSASPDSVVIDSLTGANPSSITAAYYFFRYLVPSLTTDQMREKLKTFAPEISNSIYLTMVSQRIGVLEEVAVGKKFKDFELPDTTGTMIKFSDIAGKGKYVLLDFWASWCPPCREENPNVVANFLKYAEKGFTVFGVSLDRNRENWIKGIEHDGLHWTNVSDLKFWECAPAALYGVGSIPSNVLIAPDGTIIARDVRGEDLSAKLAELIGDKK